MTDVGPPPKRRRRRILVTILLFALGVTWWYWPRGDARFVGTWGLSRSSQGRTIHVLEMSRNGGGWARSVSSGRTTPFAWRVSGNTLTIGVGPRGLGNPIFQFCRLIQSATGWHPWIITAEDWEIRQVTADSIEIWPVGGSEAYVLRRARE